MRRQVFPTALEEKENNSRNAWQCRQSCQGEMEMGQPFHTSNPALSRDPWDQKHIHRATKCITTG